jgi:Response regulator containing CheY-like receiver, AAA-type ATPase, and DNA-binding domains
MAKPQLRILYGEGDEDVLKKQAADMEKAGHRVQQALGRKAADEALKKSTFDLVVLGASLTRNDRHHLPYMAKKANAEISVLVLHADGTRHPYVDACVDTGASIENVLNRIESMKIAGMMPAVNAAAAGAGR